MTKERVLELQKCNEGLEKMTMQYPSPNEIEEIASRLLTLEAENEKLAQNAKDWHEAWMKETLKNEQLRKELFPDTLLHKPMKRKE